MYIVFIYCDFKQKCKIVLIFLEENKHPGVNIKVIFLELFKSLIYFILPINILRHENDTEQNNLLSESLQNLCSQMIKGPMP